MKYIIEAFSLLIVLMFNLVMCIGVVSVSADVAAAKAFKADVVAEIENSHFNPYVIAGCEAQAAEEGYILEVTPSVYGENGRMAIAEVRLSYTYEIPVLGISQQRVIRGIAR